MLWELEKILRSSQKTWFADFNILRILRNLGLRFYTLIQFFYFATLCWYSEKQRIARTNILVNKLMNLKKVFYLKILVKPVESQCSTFVFKWILSPCVPVAKILAAIVLKCELRDPRTGQNYVGNVKWSGETFSILIIS